MKRGKKTPAPKSSQDLDLGKMRNFDPSNIEWTPDITGNPDNNSQDGHPVGFLAFESGEKFVEHGNDPPTNDLLPLM